MNNQRVGCLKRLTANVKVYLVSRSKAGARSQHQYLLGSWPVSPRIILISYSPLPSHRCYKKPDIWFESQVTFSAEIIGRHDSRMELTVSWTKVNAVKGIQGNRQI